MAKDDKHLGMDRNITRRDFLEGSLVFAGGAAFASGRDERPCSSAAETRGLASPRDAMACLTSC